MRGQQSDSHETKTRHQMQGHYEQQQVINRDKPGRDRDREGNRERESVPVTVAVTEGLVDACRQRCCQRVQSNHLKQHIL